MRDAAWVIDGHNDLAWALRELNGYDLQAVDLRSEIAALQTDLPRLRRGGVGAQFWSVYVPCRLLGPEAVAATLEQIDFVRAMVATSDEDLALATSAEDVVQAVGSGRIASLMGMEGGHQIDNSLAVLRMMYQLGVRYLTLTHNENVDWADSATDEPVLGGLSEFGREVVGELNRLGMFVDLSHVSTDVMRDALDETSAPVIFSHSSARAVCDNPRNVPDEILVRLRTNGGVCMVTFVPMFVSQGCADWYEETLQQVEAIGGDRRKFSDVDPALEKRLLTDPPPTVTVAEVADHVDHVREVAGLEHVGLGGDYDGCAFFPDGLADVAGYPRLLTALEERGWNEAELVALTNGNALRAMRDMQDVANLEGSR
jgi:membrane dipeptidase